MKGIEGIVVGLVDLGEADRIVRLLTADEGRTSVLARGARGSRRRYGGVFELGARVQVERGRGRGPLPSVSERALLRIVGLPVAVGNAVPEVRAVCHHQLTRSGGRGAVREFVEDFLKARGEWDVAWNRYVDARSELKDEAIA